MIEYLPEFHTTVRFKKDVIEKSSLDQSLYQIVHSTSNFGVRRIWIAMHFCEPKPESALPVGDGTSGAYDDDGTGIWSLSTELFEFFSDDEAEQIMELEAVDAEMLRHAIG